MIEVGASIPAVSVVRMGDDGPEPVDMRELCAGRRVALFAVPGAFTPTCSISHLPGFRDQADALAAAGVDLICGISVNDIFVMTAWGRDQQVGDKVLLLADGSGDFTKAVGLEFDGTPFGMGLRSKRYSMLIEDGVVLRLNVEEDGAFEVSSAEKLLQDLSAA